MFGQGRLRRRVGRARRWPKRNIASHGSRPRSSARVCTTRDANRTSLARSEGHRPRTSIEPAVARLGQGWPSSAHRLESTTGSNGALVLDDTYNSNLRGRRSPFRSLRRPARALRSVCRHSWDGRAGGRLQQRENTALARSAAAVATDLVVVGRTNRRALLKGVQGRQTRGDRVSGAQDGEPAGGRPSLSVVQVPTHDAAVSWVQANVGRGDVVLFENDLPDHYP